MDRCPHFTGVWATSVSCLFVNVALCVPVCICLCTCPCIWACVCMCAYVYMYEMLLRNQQKGQRHLKTGCCPIQDCRASACLGKRANLPQAEGCCMIGPRVLPLRTVPHHGIDCSKEGPNSHWHNGLRPKFSSVYGAQDSGWDVESTFPVGSTG